MMVVAHTQLVSGGRPGRLDAPDQIGREELIEGVVHRLPGRGAEHLLHDLGDLRHASVRHHLKHVENGQADRGRTQPSAAEPHRRGLGRFHRRAILRPFG